MDEQSTVIIGAGLTGLSCAHHLGGDYLLVEREMEPGGIVRTRVRQKAFMCDGTGHWLHLRNAGMKELVNKPGADLKPQFKRFSMALDKLAAASARNQRMEHEVSRKSTAYFQAWDKELAAMNYEVIRARSQARKVEATNDFHSVHLRYVEAQTAMQPMLSYFEDLRKALSADLTQRGLEAIKPIVVNAEENAAKVQVALNRLTGELTASGTRLSSFAFQNVAPGAAGSSTK